MKLLKSVFALVVVSVLAAAILWGRELKTVNSVSQVGDNPYLYTMVYSAPYDLDDVLASNIDGNAELLNYVVKKVAKGLPVHLNVSKKDSGSFNCTSFQVKNAGGDGYFYGRNYDFFKNPSLVTYSHPKHGYASVAVSDMSHFGYSLEKLPVDLKSKILAIASIYAPVDGINEKGLCTSIMALPNQPARQDNGKPIAGTTIIMRLFLDRCASVNEALALLETVDVRHDVPAGSGYHYMVADAEGDCAVIEFDLEDGWKTLIVRKKEGDNSLLVTNHLLSSKYNTPEHNPAYGNPHSRSWWRYETASSYIDSLGGVMNREQALECLSKVHWKDLVWENGMIENTQYSALYDQSDPTLYLRSWYDYDTTEIFPLK